MNNFQRYLPVQFMVIIAGCIFTTQVSGYNPLNLLGRSAAEYALTGWSKAPLKYGNEFLVISTADYLPPSDDLPCYRVVSFLYAGKGSTILDDFLTECYTPESTAGTFVHPLIVPLTQNDGSVVNTPVNHLRYFNKAMFRMIGGNIRLVFKTDEDPSQCLKSEFTVSSDGIISRTENRRKVPCSEDLDVLPSNYVLSATGGVGTFEPAGDWMLVNPWAPVGYATREYFREVKGVRLCFRLAVILAQGMFVHAAKLTCGEPKGVFVSDKEFFIDYAVYVKEDMYIRQEDAKSKTNYLVYLNSRNNECWFKNITFVDTDKGQLRHVLKQGAVYVAGKCKSLVESNVIPRTIAERLETETPSGVFPAYNELKQFTKHSKAYTYDNGGMFGIVVQTSWKGDESEHNIVTTFAGLGVMAKPVMPVIVDARSDRHIVTKGQNKIFYGTDVAVKYDSGTTLFEVLVRVGESNCKRTKFSVKTVDVQQLPDVAYDPNVETWSDDECKDLIEGAHLSHNDQLQFEKFEKEIEDYEELFWWP